MPIHSGHIRSICTNFVAAFGILILLAGCARTEQPVPSASPVPADKSTATEAPIPPTATDEPTPIPTVFVIPEGLIQVPVPGFARETADRLSQASHPARDYYESAIQLLGQTPESLTPEPLYTPPLAIDDRANFYYNADLRGGMRTVPARLRYISDHAYWWGGVNTRIDDADFLAAAESFEALVLPTNRLVFGREWSPGIDADPRIHFLVLQEETWRGYFGYFSRINEYPTAIEPFSNQKEMMVLNASAVSLSSDTFTGKLAHEFQHLIQWNQDPNEDLWLNEAFSELAYFLSGAPTIKSAFGPTNAQLFAMNPEIQLTSRPEQRFGDEDLSAFIHYGAERAFMVYLLEQFGPEFIQKLAQNPATGVLSIQQELDQLPNQPSFDTVYANFLIANLLDARALNKAWGYREYRPYFPQREVIRSFNPTPHEDALQPYGARYYHIRSDETVDVSFTGDTLARLTSVDPFSGQYAWYSNRGDSSVFRLTRAFDLRGLDSATLNYRVWFELEDLYDFAYVEVSTDGGQTWTIQETAFGTDDDPRDRSYGFGYTGTLLDWESESLDLSAYAGQEILLRFEVFSDFTTNRDGLQLDDIEIPEIGFFDGAEDDSGGWEAEGFIRSSNFVPTNWIVWLIELSRPARVVQVELDELSHTDFTIEGFGTDFPFALLAVSPAAPTTTMDISYELIFDSP